jgi:saccharopine dehydrogenase (NAD+, L-lysine forming)
MPGLWIRSETRDTERRAPIVPADAATLTSAGVELTVEESPQRLFPAEQYAAAGARMVPAGSWPGAPADQYILGLKELPDEPAALRHRHIYFGHAYKQQHGAGALLDRFAAGGGTLLDLEYLTDNNGRRLAAFGFWAGYTGAALAVLQHRGALATPLRPLSRHDLDAELAGHHEAPPPRVLVIGALGRSGRGARAALQAAGLTSTDWDIAQTRQLDRAALLGHDILVNTVLVTSRVPPFLRPEDLDDPARRLSLVSDVACDVTSEFNPLPVYDSVTTWDQPVRRLRDGTPPLDIIAIDNLPSLLPREASVDFSAQLVPLLLELDDGDTPASPVWQRCLRAFIQAHPHSVLFKTPELDFSQDHEKVLNNTTTEVSHA